MSDTTETVTSSKPETKPLRCKNCKAVETHDEAGHSSLSYTYGVCLDCLMNWR